MSLLLFHLLFTVLGIRANDFPSLMTANATMAVVVDKRFFKDQTDFERALIEIYKVSSGAIEDNMSFGSIGIHVFRDFSMNFRRDYTILMSVATCHETWSLFRNAQKENLVHLAITDADCPRLPESEGITVPVIDPGEELPQLLLDLRMTKTLSWTRINVLHDNLIGRNMITRVLRALSTELPDKSIPLSSISVFTIKHQESEWARRKEVERILSDFKVKQLGSCFLFVVTEDTVGTIMDVARSLKMVDPESQWLYVISDTAEGKGNVTKFEEILGEGENIAFIHNQTSSKNTCNNGLMCHVKELSKSLAVALEKSVLEEIDLYAQVTDEEFDELRMTKTERRREVIRNMNKELSKKRSSFGGSCGRCVSWIVTSGITWGISFTARNGESTAYLMESGSWSPGPGVNMTDLVFPHVKHRFRGKTLLIVTFHNPPWQIVTFNRTGDTVYTGLIFDIVQHLSRALNFTYTVVTPTDDKETHVKNYTDEVKLLKKGMDRVSPSATNSVPGNVIELVRSGKVLIAACAYTVNEDRKALINFTLPVSIQTYSLLASRPRHLSRALLFMSPYTIETWGCLAAAIIIMGPILYVVHNFSPYYTNRRVSPGLRSPWDCVWYVYGALLQQGGMHLPEADSGRLIVGTWWLVVLVVVSTYSGNLVAFLTFPRIDASVSTVEDLLERRNELTWGFPAGSFLEEYLKGSTETKYRDILAGAERYDYSNDTDPVKRVKDGKHVLIDWRTSLRFLMRRELLATGRCDYSLGSEEFMNEPIAMIMAQNSPYLTMINVELKRMHQMGLIHKWTSEKLPMKDKCWEGPGSNQETNNHKVNIDDMQGSFFVLFIGFVVAIVILTCEYCWHRRKLAKERKLIRPFAS